MPLAVRKYLWLDDRWAEPWLTRPTVPSASRLVKWRWTVEWASPKMPANSAESINGIRLRKWSICRSERGILASPFHAVSYSGN